MPLRRTPIGVRSSKANIPNWESGYSQAFPTSKPGFIYYKWQGQNANEWYFYHSLYVDPQTGEVVYLVLWTDGQRIFQRYTHQRNQPLWTEYTDCDLVALKKYRDEKYQLVLSQLQSDHRAYYTAQHFEADRLFRACQQIKLRR